MRISRSTTTSAACSFICAISLFIGCTKKKEPEPQAEPGTPVPSVPAASDTISPVPFPTSLGIPGFTFPEDSTTIYGWLDANDTAGIEGHAWGIWAGLTAGSGEQYKGQELLVFETWLGIADLVAQVQQGDTTTDCGALVRVGRRPLNRPNQFAHAARAARRRLGSAQGIVDTTAQDSLWVSVSYDPNAACFATRNQIFKESVLNGYVKPGAIGAIPPFPNNAITLKPTYFVAKAKDSLVVIPVWPGPPSPPAAFPSSSFNAYVYADVGNHQPAGKKLVPAGPNPTPAQVEAATGNLNDFIHYAIDSVAAAYINQQQAIGASAGDLAILVAMHVATKEISNWTWQTFYWAPDPDNPLSPSSTATASRRPAQVKGPAAHYALSTAYAMVMPNQPITGGTNKGVTPVIGYNPYLEAVFGPSVFGVKNEMNSSFQYGIQTNCMSCHAGAIYDPGNPPGGEYSTDQYIDLKSAYFTGKVQLDFAWSINSSLIPPTAQK